MTASRMIGWSSLTLCAAAMVPALYLQGMVKGLLLGAIPGGPQTAVCALLGLVLLSYRR